MAPSKKGDLGRECGQVGLNDTAIWRNVNPGPTDTSSLRRCRELVHQHRDVPMDFADATLVALAEELGTRRVFTLDADFDVYRLPRRVRFELVPDVPRRRRRR